MEVARPAQLAPMPIPAGFSLPVDRAFDRGSTEPLSARLSFLRAAPLADFSCASHETLRTLKFDQMSCDRCADDVDNLLPMSGT